MTGKVTFEMLHINMISVITFQNYEFFVQNIARDNDIEDVNELCICKISQSIFLMTPHVCWLVRWVGWSVIKS